MSYSSGDIEVQQTTNQMPVDNHQSGDGSWARAIYDYEACSKEELSFITGTLIRILRKDENGIDDGFWEGELNGKVGVFPSLVVEELGVDVWNDMQSPEERHPPPAFVPPPPVTITAATPESESPPSLNSVIKLQGSPQRARKNQRSYSLKTDLPNGDHQNGHKRVHFQETHRETFTILKTWKSCPRSVEEMCVFDAEFSEDGEESLV
uniref:SH3 domain-containing protein n=1 Tax=Magallana gigas TaxID=29159 RepID=A0A8W8LH74_MAGGI